MICGHADWRLPTIEETLSLLGREKDGHGHTFTRAFPLNRDMLYR